MQSFTQQSRTDAPRGNDVVSYHPLSNDSRHSIFPHHIPGHSGAGSERLIRGANFKLCKSLKISIGEITMQTSAKGCERMRRGMGALALTIAIIFSVLPLAPNRAMAQEFSSLTPLEQLAVTATTGEKPQSKVWTHDGYWWTVMPNSTGTKLFRLDGTSWTNVLSISSATDAHADVQVAGNMVHILLFRGTSSELVSVEYVSASHAYQMWTTRPTAVPITLDNGVETATIDIDSNGRMWLASDGTTSVNVRWSDSPYSSWSSPINLAGNISLDDICDVIAFDGKVGVLWSNQTTQRFGFRVHVDGTDPASWSADEVPASQSARNIGAGMADDHLNISVGIGGTGNVKHIGPGRPVQPE